MVADRQVMKTSFSEPGARRAMTAPAPGPCRASCAHALEFELGNVNVDVDSTLTYSAIRRLDKADSQFLHNPTDVAEIASVYSLGAQEALNHTIEMQKDDGRRMLTISVCGTASRFSNPHDQADKQITEGTRVQFTLRYVAL